MVIGLATATYLHVVLPQPQGEGLKNQGFIGSLRDTLGAVWKAIFLIWLVMVLRAVVGQSFLTFLPVLYVEKGYSLVSAGSIFFMLFAIG